jgi:hypothetical protein
MNNIITAPFDLPQVASRYKIQVDPRIAAVMELADIDHGSEIERQSIHLIYPFLQQLSPSCWTFSIPHHYGLKVSERKFVEKAFATQLEFQARSLELISKIAQDTGLKVAEIAATLQADTGNLINDPMFAPYAADFVRLMQEQEADVPYELCVATAHLRRVIGEEWGIQHTEALHPAIYNQVIDFAREEENLAIQPEEEPGKAPALMPKSSSSDPTSPPAGIPSDTISNPGASPALATGP